MHHPKLLVHGRESIMFQCIIDNAGWVTTRITQFTHTTQNIVPCSGGNSKLSGGSPAMNSQVWGGMAHVIDGYSAIKRSQP